MVGNDDVDQNLAKITEIQISAKIVRSLMNFCTNILNVEFGAVLLLQVVLFTLAAVVAPAFLIYQYAVLFSASSFWCLE